MSISLIIGRLLYLIITQPYLSYFVQVLSQFMQDPRQPYLIAVMHVLLHYIKSSHGQGLFIPSSSTLQLASYCDSDWVSCPITRRSTSGYIVFLGDSPIFWKSKKQVTVSYSSAEAECRAMASATSELIWLCSLLLDLQIDCSSPTYLYIATTK